MTNKYDDLSKKIMEARKVGQAAADKVQDGGTCNLDKVVIYRLPRVRESTLNNAGINCYKHWSFSGSFVLSGCYGQGDKNTVGIQAMADHLKSLGVDCYVHSQMD